MRRVQWLWSGWPGQARAHVQLFHPHELEQLHLSQCVSRRQGLRSETEGKEGRKLESRKRKRESRVSRFCHLDATARKPFQKSHSSLEYCDMLVPCCTTSTFLHYRKKQSAIDRTFFFVSLRYQTTAMYDHTRVHLGLIPCSS